MVETLIICLLREFEKELLNMKMPLNLLACFFCDGGLDENSRFPNTLNAFVQLFKKYNLDESLILTHAPGLSAYNQVERRMAPFSKTLSGISLPHETFWTNLDLSRKTINTNLEKRHFKAAAEVFPKFWIKKYFSKLFCCG